MPKVSFRVEFEQTRAEWRFRRSIQMRCAVPPPSTALPLALSARGRQPWTSDCVPRAVTVKRDSGSVIVERVEFDGDAIVEARGGIARDLIGANQVGAAIEAGEREIKRPIVVQDDDARAVARRLLGVRHPELVGHGTRFPSRFVRDPVDHQRSDRTLRGNRPRVPCWRTHGRSRRLRLGGASPEDTYEQHGEKAPAIAARNARSILDPTDCGSWSLRGGGVCSASI